MTAPNGNLAAQVREARRMLAEYGTGAGTKAQWADSFAAVLRALLAVVDTPPAAVDQAARDTLPLHQALGEIAALYPGTAYIAGGWLRGERTDPVDDVTYQLYALPDDLESARDVVLVAVRSRQDRHAAESGSDGDR